MAEPIRITTEPGRASLAGALDFNNAPQALTDVGDIISRESALIVDLADITEANSAGLALLLEWTGMAKRNGHQLELINIPSSLQQLADVCQVDSLI